MNFHGTYELHDRYINNFLQVALICWMREIYSAIHVFLRLPLKKMFTHKTVVGYEPHLLCEYDMMQNEFKWEYFFLCEAAFQMWWKIFSTRIHVLIQFILIW